MVHDSAAAAVHIAAALDRDVMTNDRDSFTFWNSFLYEVNKATIALMYLLQGMEAARNSELDSYVEVDTGQDLRGSLSPKVPNVDIPLVIAGKSTDIIGLIERGGDAEQLAFKGWVEQVYSCIWESSFRNEMKDRSYGTDVIRPLSGPIGDFGYIRNDLVHNRGVATTKETGRCTVLKWFEPGQPIVLSMRHVFDFLNHMGLMTQMAGFTQDGISCGWIVLPEMEQSLNSRPIPNLVSVTTALVRQLDDGTIHYAVRVVFENGVFVNIPVDCPPDGKSIQQRIKGVEGTNIDRDGNLRFPNGHVITPESLYKEAVDVMVGGGQQIEGMPIPGPWFQYRKL